MTFPILITVHACVICYMSRLWKELAHRGAANGARPNCCNNFAKTGFSHHTGAAPFLKRKECKSDRIEGSYWQRAVVITIHNIIIREKERTRLQLSFYKNEKLPKNCLSLLYSTAAATHPSRFMNTIFWLDSFYDFFFMWCFFMR